MIVQKNYNQKLKEVYINLQKSLKDDGHVTGFQCLVACERIIAGKPPNKKYEVYDWVDLDGIPHLWRG